MSHVPCNEMDISHSPASNNELHTSKKPIISRALSSCSKVDMTVATPENPSHSSRNSSRITPFGKRRVFYNPFNRNLKEQFEKSVFSPTVFSVIVSPCQDSPEFKWSIEELSAVKPADIEDEILWDDQLDEQTESEIQKTIDKYFTSTHVVPSPWSCRLPSSWKSFVEAQSTTTGDSSSVASAEILNASSLHTSSTQTSLSLPPDLPDSVTSVLRPYFSHLHIGNSESPSVERKSFYYSQEEPLSPVNWLGSPLLSGGIVKSSNNLYHPSTPVIESRTIGTPLPNLSPTDLSPVRADPEKLEECSSVSAMQVDGSSYFLSEDNRRNSFSIHSDKSEEDIVSSNSFSGALLESPKFSRLNNGKKRRRVLPRRNDTVLEMNLDNSYSFFQDTGYSTDYTKSRVIKNIMRQGKRCLRLSSESLNGEEWSAENKENVLIASTPTRRP